MRNEQLPSSPVTLTLAGIGFSKKNNYRPRRGGGKAFYKPDWVNAEIEAFLWQIREQWEYGVLDKAALYFRFYVPSGRMDLDGCQTMAIDLLKGIVIVNDSIAHVKKIGAEAIISDDPRIEITIVPV